MCIRDSIRGGVFAESPILFLVPEVRSEGNTRSPEVRSAEVRSEGNRWKAACGKCDAEALRCGGEAFPTRIPGYTGGPVLRGPVRVRSGPRVICGNQPAESGAEVRSRR